MRYYVFTWNMARGRSMVDHPNASGDDQERGQARYTVLMEHCLSSGIGFIQEAGVDIHGTIRNSVDSPLPVGRSAWRASMRADFQQGASPCRGAVFCQAGDMRVVHLDQMSGGWDAERYPAACIANLGQYRILLASFHATSSGNASANTIDFLTLVDDYATKAPVDAVLVGADFNCQTFPGIRYPIGPTQQRGGTIDGFYVYKPKSSRAKKVALYHVRRSVQPGHREMRVGQGALANIGYFANAEIGGTLVKVSDHAPVLGQFEII